MIDKLARFFLGYDVFVSYSRRDADRYVRHLAAMLQTRGVVCFLDHQDMVAGEALDPSLVRAIQRSRVLLLIGTPGAAGSPHVALEVETARKLRKKIVPVDTGNMRRHEAWSDVRSAIWIDEAPEHLHKGRPSDEVLDEVEKRFDHFGRSRLMRTILGAVILGLIGLTIWALVERSEALQQRAEAESQRDLAESQRELAEAQRELAERERARADKQRIEAQENLARAFLEKGDRAWERRDVTAAEIFFAKSLTLEDAPSTRSRLLETRAVGVSLDWTSPFRPKGHAIDSDGSIVVVAHTSGPISVFDAATGELHGRLRGHEGGVSALALHNGRLLSGGLEEGIVRLWDPKSGALIAEHSAHTGRVLAVGGGAQGGYWSVGKDDIIVKWQPNGGETETWSANPGLLNSAAVCPGMEQIVLGSESGAIALWSAGASESFALENPIRGVACSADGKQYAAVDSSGMVVVREAENPTAQKTFAIEKGSGLFDAGIVFSPDGQLLALGGASAIEVWRWAEPSREVRFTLDGESFVLPLFSLEDASGSVLFSAGDSLRAWNLAMERSIERFPGHGKSVYAVDFRPPRDRIVASGSFDDTLRYWDTETGKQLRVVSTGENVLSVSFTPDGQSVCLAVWGGLLQCRDSDSDRVLFSARHPFTSPRLAVSPVGGVLAASGGGSLSVWDLRTQARRAQLSASDAFAFSPDGRSIASASGKQLRLVDPETGSVDLTIPLAFEIEAVAWSPDGTQILAAESEGQTRRNKRLRLQRIDPRTGEAGALLERTSYEVYALRFCPSSQCFATTGWQAADLWDARTGEKIATLDPRFSGRKYVVDAAFSSEGRRLALASERGSVEIWHLDQRREATNLRGIAERTLSVDACPNSQVMAAAKTDGTLEIWRGDSARPERLLKLADKPVVTTAFSPSGNLLAAGATSGEVSISRLDSSAEPIARSLGSTAVGTLLFLAEDELLAGLFETQPNSGAPWLVWNLETDTVRSLSNVMPPSVLAMAVNPSRSMIAVAGRGRTVKIHRLPTLDETAVIKGHRGTITGLEFSGSLLLSSSRDGSVRGWRLADQQPVFAYGGFDHWVEDVAALPNERIAAVGSRGTLNVYSSISSAAWSMRVFHSKVTENYSWIKELDFDPAHGQLWVSSGESMEIKRLDLSEIERTRNADPIELLKESSSHTGLWVDGTEAVPTRVFKTRPE